MLGFDRSGDGVRLSEQYDTLAKKVPEKYHKELVHAYSWMTNVHMVDGYKMNSKEQWEFCKKAVENAPEQYLDTMISSSTPTVLAAPVYPKRERLVPKCHLCEEELAPCITHKIKFGLISCPCQRMYCHKKCGDEHLLQDPSCFICKNYYVYDVKTASLQSMFAIH